MTERRSQERNGTLGGKKGHLFISQHWVSESEDVSGHDMKKQYLGLNLEAAPDWSQAGKD